MTTKTIQTHFKRVEKKYILSKETLQLIQEEFKQHLVPDDYPESSITNIYFDSLDFQMIQDALERKNERKKLRMRLYVPNPSMDSQAFLEMKYKDQFSIGHKFRLTSSAQAILDFVENEDGNSGIHDARFAAELDQLRAQYGPISPMMFIYYDRYSMKGMADPSLRITVDQNIRFRDQHVTIEAGNEGYPLIDADSVIMEIKVSNGSPDWLEAILEKYQLVNQSFSKYGNAYLKSQALKKEATALV